MIERGVRGDDSPNAPFRALRSYCAACDRIMPAGPDICLGYLPGVSHACCGHGGAVEAYAVLGGRPDECAASIENSLTLRGIEALAFFGIVELARYRENDLYACMEREAER